MKLLNLILLNFQGIRRFEFEPQGLSASIYADNGVGKTTLFSAFRWLLFGKDANNRADFDIKTLDADGNPYHHLDHEVIGVFDNSGRTVTLRRVYAEDWTQKRGAASREMSGHTTSYFIDDVPKSKKEYDAFIAGLCDEETFKILTDPTYFNDDEAMAVKTKAGVKPGWKRRREIIIEACGDISDAEVIASDPDLAALTHILQGRTIDDVRAVIKAAQSKINDELKMLPIRIDEATRTLPDITGLNHPDVIAVEIVSLKKQQAQRQAEKVRTESGGEVAEKKKALSEAESRLIDIRNRIYTAHDVKLTEKRSEYYKLSGRIDDLKVAAQTKARAIEQNARTIQLLEKTRESLLAEWNEIADREFVFEQDDVCPTCGQSLPEDRLEKARETALTDYNRHKSELLEANKAKGKQCRVNLDKLKAENIGLEKELADITAELEAIENSKTVLRDVMDRMMEESAKAIADDPEYLRTTTEIEAIKAQISELDVDRQNVAARIQTEIDVLEQEIASRERSLLLIEQQLQGKKRIKDLESQEKTLAAEFERLQDQLYLTDQFIRQKVSLFDSKINSRFKLARFKLFSQNINGGLEECCEATYNGVPYSSGLNAGHRIIVGMDIIRTLSAHYGFTAPIFIDNAESVTSLPAMDAQVIRLVKPEIRTEEDRKKYSKLVVELEDQNQLKEAI